MYRNTFAFALCGLICIQAAAAATKRAAFINHGILPAAHLIHSAQPTTNLLGAGGLQTGRLAAAEALQPTGHLLTPVSFAEAQQAPTCSCGNAGCTCGKQGCSCGKQGCSCGKQNCSCNQEAACEQCGCSKCACNAQTQVQTQAEQPLAAHYIGHIHAPFFLE